MIDITLDDREVREALERLARRLADMTPVMREIGETLVERAKQRFATSTGPDGASWAPNAPATIAAYLRQYQGSYSKRGGLTKRGQARAAAKKPLIGETKSLIGTLYYRADRSSVTVGSPMEYAAIHQFGGHAGRGRRQRDEVQRFAADLWLHLGNIQHHLLAGTYRMGAYRRFVVYEPKRREILAAPFADRVVQHAILNVLQPVWDQQMIDHAYACRPGKGTHAGTNRLQQWLRDMARQRPLEDIWVAKTDFYTYFRSIRHDDIKSIVRRKIACAGTIALLDAIIDSTPGGVGIPVGNLTSQWLANLLGNEIDQRIKRELGVKRYLRYMDDCIALFWTKAEAQRYVERLCDLGAELSLSFSEVSIHRASHGINALGYRIWPTHRLLRKRAIVAFKRDIKRLVSRGEHNARSVLRCARLAC